MTNLQIAFNKEITSTLTKSNDMSSELLAISQAVFRLEMKENPTTENFVTDLQTMKNAKEMANNAMVYLKELTDHLEKLDSMLQESYYEGTEWE